MSSARTRAAGRMAVALVAALWLLAGTAFVQTNGPVQEKGLRGMGHELAPRPLSAAGAAAGEAAPQLSWSSVVAFAAAFGLVASIATTPVRAEEAAVEPAKKSAVEIFKAESAKEAEMRAAAPGREDRVKKDIAQLAAEKSVTLDESVMGQMPSGGKKSKSTQKLIKKEKKAEAGGSASAPAANFGAKVTESKKVIFSPSDEMDEDEKPLSASNPVLLFVLAIFAPAIYLFFYVAGSLDII